LKKYEKSATILDFLDTVKSDLPAEDYRFLKSKLSAPKMMKAKPMIRMSGSKSVRIEFQGSMAELRVISMEDQIFALNNRELNFSKDSAEARWNKIVGALPKTASHHSIWSLFVPAANAQVWEEVLGYLVIAGAAIAITTWFGSGYNCETIGTQITNCEWGNRGASDNLERRVPLTDKQRSDMKTDYENLRKLDAGKFQSCGFGRRFNDCLTEISKNCAKAGCDSAVAGSPAGNASGK
jgi:hypothetical protein